MTLSIYSLFVLGAILTCILTPLVRYLALQKGFVDCPQRARKVHQQATPRLGGASVLISFGDCHIAVITIPQLNGLLWGNKSSDWVYHPWFDWYFCYWFSRRPRPFISQDQLLGEFLIAALVVWGANLSFISVQFTDLARLVFGNGSVLDFLVFGSSVWQMRST